MTQLILCDDLVPELRAHLGGYRDHFAAALGGTELHVVDAVAGQRPAHGLPTVLSGARAMVGERLPWMGALQDWLRPALREQTPLLAVCFSHQLLADALGGTVGPCPGGTEFGSSPVYLEEVAQGDPLFGDLPHVFEAQQAHAQSVIHLPPGVEVLGRSPADPHHILRWGPRAWSVQFHPERDAATSHAILRHRGLPGTPLPSPHASELLARFAWLFAGMDGNRASARA